MCQIVFFHHDLIGSARISERCKTGKHRLLNVFQHLWSHSHLYLLSDFITHSTCRQGRNHRPFDREQSLFLVQLCAATFRLGLARKEQSKWLQIRLVPRRRFRWRLGTLPSLHKEEYCAFSEAKLLCQFHVRARSRLQCHKTTWKLKFISLDAGLRIEDYLLRHWDTVSDVVEHPVIDVLEPPSVQQRETPRRTRIHRIVLICFFSRTVLRWSRWSSRTAASCFKNASRWFRLYFGENRFDFEHSYEIRKHHASSCWYVDHGFHFTTALDTTDTTSWSFGTSNTFLKPFFGSNLLDGNMSKRAGNIDNEQVSAKSKPARGLCPLKRNDGPEAMKEDGCNEDFPSNTSWRNPMPSTKRKWRPAAPKPPGDPSIDFQPPSDEGNDMKDHIIRNMCSKLETDINKLDIFTV